MPAHTARVYRADAGPTLQKPRQLPNGFVEVDAVLSRTGIYEYPDASLPGGIRREMRLPEEVFAPAALEGFRGSPVTQEHPPMMLTPANTRPYLRGAVITPARRDGDVAVATLVIHDATLAEEVMSGERDGVSPGYFLNLEPAPPGTRVDGKEIHAYQRNISPNHTAIVKFPRGGDGVRVHRGDGKEARLDGLSAPADDGSTPDGGPAAPGERSMTTTATGSTRTIRVDGISGEVPQHLAEAYEREQRARLDAEKKLGEEKAALEKKVGETQARADALEADKKKLEEEKKRLDGELTQAKDPKAKAADIKARVRLERVAERALGATTLKMDSGAEVPLSDVEDKPLRLAVMQKRVPDFKMDSIPEAQRDFYLTARFNEEAARIDAEEEQDANDTPADGKTRTDSTSNEPRTVPAPGVKLQPSRRSNTDAARVDAKEAWQQERNLDGLLPSERKRREEELARSRQ